MSDNAPTVEILLSTYNGEKYLPELLKSIIRQSYDNWRILIRDDGSTDNTIESLQSFQDSYLKRVNLITDDQKHLGACKSFARLLSVSSAELVLLCDQDDIWSHDKLKIMVERYNKIVEGRPLENLGPILLFSDLEIVDSEINPLHDSFWNNENIFSDLTPDLYMTFFKNFSPGCAMMLNREMVKLSYSIPQEAIMHDWWISLHASLKGHIEAIPDKLVMYRIHPLNTIGIKQNRTVNPFKRTLEVLACRHNIYRTFKNQRRLISQAKAFCKANGLRFNMFKYLSRIIKWYIHYYTKKK